MMPGHDTSYEVRFEEQLIVRVKFNKLCKNFISFARICQKLTTTLFCAQKRLKSVAKIEELIIGSKFVWNEEKCLISFSKLDSSM